MSIRDRFRAFSGPPYNHTRDDGPFAPCHLCLQLMSRESLIELASDQEVTNGDLTAEVKALRPVAWAAERLADNFNEEPVGLAPIEQRVVDALKVWKEWDQ